MGIYSAGIWGTGFSTIASFYPRNEGLIAGVIESAYGAGQMLGPFIGNFLFSIGGFSWPFIFAGLLEIGTAITCLITVPTLKEINASKAKQASDDEIESLLISSSSSSNIGDDSLSLKQPARISAFGYLSAIPVIFASLPLATVNSSMGFISVALGPYLLQEFNVDSKDNAKYFFAIFGVTTISSAFMGVLIDRGYGGKLYASTIILSSAGYFILMIPGFYPKAAHITLFYIALVLLGFSIAGAYTGSYIVNEKACLLLGVQDPGTVKIYVLTGLNCWLAVGITTGQVFTGGFIYNQSNFYMACLAEFAIIFVIGIPTIYWMWRNKLLSQLFYHGEGDDEFSKFIRERNERANRTPKVAADSIKVAQTGYFQSSGSRSRADSINAMISSSVRIY